MRALILPVPVQAIVVDVGTIQQPAKTVCVEVRGVEGPVSSRGWVYHFRKRHGISNGMQRCTSLSRRAMVPRIAPKVV